jgi:cytochrome c peroxidase
MDKKISFSLLCLLFLAGACRQTAPIKDNADVTLTSCILKVSSGLPSLSVSVSNPITNGGAELGRMLFYPQLPSYTSTLSFASSCKFTFGMSDRATVFSKGIDEIYEKKNTMPFSNLLWASAFFMDGRNSSLGEQVPKPVFGVIKTHQRLPDMGTALNQHAYFASLFMQDFGTRILIPELAGKAIEQVESTLLSFSSMFNLNNRGTSLSPYVYREWQIFGGGASQFFYSPLLLSGGDRFQNRRGERSQLFSTCEFYTNGLDLIPDLGCFSVTMHPAALGKFIIPSLRNLIYAGSFMLDGHFDNEEGVVRSYNSANIYILSNRASNIKEHKTNHLLLWTWNIEDVVDFLNAINDEVFT